MRTYFTQTSLSSITGQSKWPHAGAAAGAVRREDEVTYGARAFVPSMNIISQFLLPSKHTEKNQDVQPSFGGSMV